MRRREGGTEVAGEHKSRQPMPMPTNRTTRVRRPSLASRFMAVAAASFYLQVNFAAALACNLRRGSWHVYGLAGARLRNCPTRKAKGFDFGFGKRVLRVGYVLLVFVVVPASLGYHFSSLMTGRLLRCVCVCTRYGLAEATCSYMRTATATGGLSIAS
jgi:hypothetical protein